MLTITRRLEIDAGHRLQGHESKCRNVHGHRYVFDVECSAEGLDAVGRIIDFGEVKRLVGGWLDDHLDHGFMYEDGDPAGAWVEAAALKRFVFPAGRPPTAENIATMVLTKARELLAPRDIHVVSVTVWETPNCYAKASG